MALRDFLFCFIPDVVEAGTMRLVSMTGTKSWPEMFLILAAMKSLKIVERGRLHIPKSE